jgi:MoaA/NifB/PqqE/SkfB family radical SAM enzyme
MDTLQVGPEPCSTLGLSFLWLEITAKCNLECVHCYADSGPGQPLLGAMNSEAWLTILQDAADLGCRQVQFIGGEPTLHPDLGRFIESASAQRYELIEVYTNATHLNGEILRVLTRHRVNVAVSFYSDDPQTHDAITGRQGSFGRTVANLRRLVDAGLPVRAGIIETHKNREHGERARQFLKSLGITDAKIDRQRGIGRAAKAAGNVDPMGELCGECWKGKLCVTSSGMAYPCVFSRFSRVGNARDGVRAIVDGKLLDNFRRELRSYQGSNATEGVEYSTVSGCDPNCSPCDPGVFKCAPGCSPGSCAPRSAQLARERNDVEGKPTDGSGAVLSPPTPQCNPTCHPSTCSPCGPGDFKQPPKCSPDRCAPRLAQHARERNDVEGKPTDGSGAVLSPPTPQCNPTCHPSTCSPCGPGDFKRCAPPSALQSV